MEDIAKYRRARWDRKIAEVVASERVEVANAHERAAATGFSGGTGIANIVLLAYLKGIKPVMDEAFAVERELLKNGSVPEEEKTEKRLRELFNGLLTERIAHILKELENSNMTRGSTKGYLEGQLRREKEEWMQKIQDEVAILLFEARQGGTDVGANPSQPSGGTASLNFTVPPTQGGQTHHVSLESLHQEIHAKCTDLYRKGAYAEAVEKGFKVVRDRLRKLTSYETGSEAFGKGKLYVKGATAPNVEEDFNKAVMFLAMSIDRFRNEKSHTSDAKIFDPVRPYEYLRLSSLAMNLLEGAELRGSGDTEQGAGSPQATAPEQRRNRRSGQSEEELLRRLSEQYNSQPDWLTLRDYVQRGKGLLGCTLSGGRQLGKVDVERFLLFFEQVAVSWESGELSLERIEQVWGRDIELLLVHRLVSTLITELRRDSPKRYVSLLKLGNALLESIPSADRKAALKRSLDMMIELPGKTF